MERGCYACTYVSDTRCRDAEGAICKFALGKLAKRGAYLMLVNNGEGRTAMTWALCKVCCVVRGAAVRSDGMVS
jgi:hypothetical protein